MTDREDALPVVAWLTCKSKDGRMEWVYGDAATNPEYVKQHHGFVWEPLVRQSDALAALEEAGAADDRKQDALHQIKQWSMAYPLEVFPEPDLKRANEVLSAAGMSLASISAKAMRHVITQVQKIADGALAKTQGLSHSSEQDEKSNVHQAESVPVASAQGDRWIPVSERLPEPEFSVLAFWPPMNGPVHAGCFATATRSEYGRWHNPEDEDDYYADPSHWMPLPSAPMSPPPPTERTAE